MTHNINGGHTGSCIPLGEMAQGALEKEEGLGWGKSLPVPSVQEMVRREPLCVPERYLRDRMEGPCEDALAASLDIPVIDFSLLSSGHQSEREKLDEACKDWGFFQIINHGIDQEVIHKMRMAVSGFFELAIDERTEYSMAENDLQGYGQAYVVSEEQKLDWCDLIFLITLPTKFRQLKYWPTAVPGFKDAVEVYSADMDRVARELLANLSQMMNMGKDGLLGLQGEMKQAMRMNYYPACCTPDEVLGVSPHSDGSSITLLLQDDGIEGLQIKHKGLWVPVKSIPNAFVVNIGDVVEVWSNGMYKSIEHRAIINKQIARMSIASFTLPEDDAEIRPLNHMVDDDHRPKMYRSMKYIDYVRHTLARKMDGKIHTHVLKLEN